MESSPERKSWATALKPNFSAVSGAGLFGLALLLAAFLACLAIFPPAAVLLLYLFVFLLGFICAKPAPREGWGKVFASGFLAGLVQMIPLIALALPAMALLYYLTSGDSLPGVAIIGIALLPFPFIGGLGGAARNLYFNFAAASRRAYEALLGPANNGDAGAMLAIGGMCAEGRGVRRDPAKAAEWFAKAAELGSAPAQRRLGELHALGQGVELDLAKAAAWYQKAAAQDDAEAQCELGLLYFKGNGVEQDLQKAFDLWTKAAAQGHDRARKNLEVLKNSPKFRKK